jgi:hypothetical protein
MDLAGSGDGLAEGVAGDPVGDGDEEGDPLPGAGPSGCAPLSVQAVVSAANVAAIAIRRFMGCLLRVGT